MLKKKGSGADQIMILVIIIAMIVIIYVIMLPPEERNRLLNYTGEDNITKGNEEIEGRVVENLLLESPGNIEPIEEDTMTHKLSPINLFIRVEPEVDVLANYLDISRSLFGGQDQSLSFDLNDLENLDNLALSFYVGDHEGSLIIELNDRVIFNGKVSTGPRVMTLPLNYLRSRNELRFYVNSPGAQFWQKNYYNLRDIKLKREFELVNSKETRTFTISESEKDILESSKLEFLYYCNSVISGEDTLFRIYLNNGLLSSQVISCGGGERSIEIDIKDIEEGKNELLFVIEQGDYSFNEIEVVNELEEEMFKTYYFYIDSDDYDKIFDDDYRVMLRFYLEKSDRKRAEIIINDNTIHLDTRENRFEKDISDLIEENENLIKIIPTNEFTIHTLRINLEED